MGTSGYDPWYSRRLAMLRQDKLALESVKVRLGLEKALAEQRLWNEETEVERRGGRNLKLPADIYKRMSRLDPKVADGVAVRLSFVAMHGGKTCEDILDAAIKHAESFPALVKYTDGEVIDYVLKVLDMVIKHLDQNPSPTRGTLPSG